VRLGKTGGGADSLLLGKDVLRQKGLQAMLLKRPKKLHIATLCTTTRKNREKSSSTSRREKGKGREKKKGKQGQAEVISPLQKKTVS